MKIKYDSEVDALYIELLSLAPGMAENLELTENIIADRSPDGQLAGLEIINASLVLGDRLKEVIVEGSQSGISQKVALL